LTQLASLIAAAFCSVSFSKEFRRLCAPEIWSQIPRFIVIALAATLKTSKLQQAHLKSATHKHTSRSDYHAACFSHLRVSAKVVY
jgi:hypothetical protein